MNDENIYQILNSHQWRKCHRETCCCSNNLVVLKNGRWIGECDTEDEAIVIIQYDKTNN